MTHFFRYRYQYRWFLPCSDLGDGPCARAGDDHGRRACRTSERQGIKVGKAMVVCGVLVVPEYDAASRLHVSVELFSRLMDDVRERDEFGKRRKDGLVYLRGTLGAAENEYGRYREIKAEVLAGTLCFKTCYLAAYRDASLGDFPSRVF